MFTDEQLFTAELSIWEEIARRREQLDSTSSSSTAVDTPTQLTYKSNYRRPTSSPAQRSHSLPSRLPSSSISAATPSAIAAAPSSASRSVPSPYCLFFTPVGIRPEGAACRSLEAVGDMFSCVAGLRDLDIVHRDLTPRHFLRCGSDVSSASHGLFLIDFGFSVLLPLHPQERRDLLIPFSGSTHFAPTSLLQQLRQLAVSPQPTYNSTPFTYCPQLAHDLESLVKVCYACVHPDHVVKLRRLDNKDAEGIAAFWNAAEGRMAKTLPSWKKAMEHARLDEFEAARQAVEENLWDNAQHISAAVTEVYR
jgi:hypothetical protein